MDRIGEGPLNSCQALCRRELGLPSRYLTSALAQRVLLNLTKNRYSETLYKGHKQTIHYLSVRYPFIATASRDDTIRLWDLERTCECQWVFNIQTHHISTLHQLRLVEDKVICMGGDADVEGDLAVQTISCKSGESIAVHKRHDLALLHRYKFGQQNDFLVIGPKQVSRWSLEDGRCLEQIPIDVKKYKGSFPHVRVWKNFLAIFYQEALAVHDLNKEESYEIKFPFKEWKMISTAFDGTRLFCAMGRKGGEEGFSCLNYQLFDFAKKTATSLYKTQSEDPALAWAPVCNVQTVLHKEWVYLGYLSGQLVAVDWVNHTLRVVENPEPISYLSLQEDILITGSYGHSYDDLGVLIFWDTKTLTQIGQVDWPSPWVAPVFSFGKLVMTEGSSLRVRDYSVQA